MDVFVFPSLYEGLSVVAIEAQAAGVPILAADTLSDETKITDCLQFYSLDASPHDWAERLRELCKEKHLLTTEAIKKAGYDIRETAEMLANDYQNIIMRKGRYVMKYIALMNTAIFSFNQGDYIIMESVKRELDYLLKDSFVVEIPTHSPMFHVTEFGIGKKNSFYDKLQKFDYKFVCGTNLLHHNMKYAKTTWNINIFDTKYFGDMILLGVGTDPKDEAVNRYTRKLYNQVLAKDVIHSTRDERTKKLLESMGFKAINTGCATMWGLTPEHCSKIPTKKK